MAKKLKCAKWCGRGCTQAEYDKAVSDAKKLQKRMGKGWQTEVWENSGWHYMLKRGDMELYPKRQGLYSTIFNSRFTASANTPQLAVWQALEAAQTHAIELTASLLRFHDLGAGNG